MTHESKTIFPRTLWGLLWDQKINGREFAALAFLFDQTDGWPVLHRMWVRLTNAEWAQGLGLSEHAARKVRDSLLEKGLIRRRKDGHSYVYQVRLPERDVEKRKAHEHTRRVLNLPRAGRGNNKNKS